jgi:WD40 repeat protein
MIHEVPVELLNHIVTYLPTAQAAAHLSSSNHALRRYFEDEGWKIFVQSRFPSFNITGNWKAAAHTLTTYSRNLDRRAFLGRYVEPSNFIVKLPQRELETKWRKPRGQTMGYQPEIDCYEEASGSTWDARKQVLAWSAGAELVVRVKSMGPRHKPDSRGTYSYFDHYNHHTRWFTYRPPRAQEGRDDITSLNLLKGVYREESSSTTDVEHAVFGTASGGLYLSHLELDRDSSKTVGGVFETGKRPVRFADIEASEENLLAAVLGDTTVALFNIPRFLYNVPEHHETIHALAETTIPQEGSRSFRIWATQFLSNDLLALGTGPSPTPVQILKLRPTGFDDEPYRKLEVRETHFETAVYSIKPLPSIVGDRRSASELFLSGGYDGITRLHDLRSPRPFVSYFFDGTDDGAIYSLQPIGRERFVAGGARHSMIKFFDLRVAGGRAYDYRDVAQSTTAQDAQDTSPDNGWNVFLNPRNDPQPRWSFSRARATESPVYSLASPSPTSATLFAGVENHVIELDFTSMLDKYPDPVFSRGIVRDHRGINITKSWNPKHDVFNLAMYEHAPGAGLRLRTQAGVGMYHGQLKGYDERWRDSGTSMTSSR